jgi:phage shock protein C
MMEKKLYRSRRDRMIAGVCGGLAEHYNADPTLVRLLAVLLAVASFGTATLAYFVMMLVVPEEPLQSPSEGGTVMQNPPEEPAHAPTGAYVAEGTAPPPPVAPPPPRMAAPPPPEPRRPRGRGGITFGLVLVFIGVALLSAQFVPGLDLWRLWPLIIVIVGVRVMFQGGDDR